MKKHILTGLFFLTALLFGCNNGSARLDSEIATNKVSLDSSSGGVADQAINVSLTPNIVLKFTTTMQPSTINDKTVFLATSALIANSALKLHTNNLIPISSITANANDTIFHFSPLSPLASNTKYYVIVTNKVQTTTGSSVSGNFSFTTGDFVTPTVSIVNPSNNATGVSTKPSIQLQFSEAVQKVTSTNLTLHEGSINGTAVAIGTIIAGANNTYTFSPTAALNQQTTYYVVLGSGITDMAGNALADTSFSFATGDFNAPTVSIVSPSNNATGVSTQPNIQLQFSEAVQNVTSTNLTLHQGNINGTAVSIGAITAGANNTYTFSPTAALNQQTTYYVVLGSGITDMAGDALADTSFSFATGDFNAPTVNIVSPSNNATGVSTKPNIQLQFSETVQNITSTNLTLHEGSISGTAVAIGAITAGANNTYTFSPTATLNQQTTYYVVLGSGITDMAGNALAGTSFSFATGDFNAPTVSIVNPSNNATGVSTQPGIQLQFSEAVQHVTSTSLTLHEESINGTAVAIGTIIAGANNTYTFSPTAVLNQQTTYYVVLGSGITDMAGNALADTNFNFTTGDFNAPTVSIVNPNNNATGVSTQPSIQLQFSEAVQNVTSTNLTLHQGSINGTAVAIGAITAGANNTYTFSPTAALNQQTTYYVVLGSGITDMAGNALADTNFSFVTGDFNAPTVSIVSPSNNATGVSTQPNIQLQFSEAVQKVTSTNLSLHQGSINGTAVVIGAITAGANNTYTFSPTAALNQQTTYYVVLGSGITDMAGNALADTSFSFTTIANTWVNVGSPGFSAGTASNQSLAIDSNGIPYVAYEDRENADKTTVMKFNGSNWINVGSPGFSAGNALNQSLAIDSNDTPYVAYRDVAKANQTTVMKFNGSNWVNVGSPGFSAGNADYQSLAIDSNGTPYVAYQDERNANKTTVMKFNGSNWVNVGSPGFSAGQAIHQSLAIDSTGIPYVAYQDAANSSKTTVMKFNGSNWVNVGSPGFSAGNSFNQSLAIDSTGIPYIAYGDVVNNFKTTVMKFDGSNWVNVGSPGFSAGSASQQSLAIDSNGIPYVAYEDRENADKTTVMKFDGSNWINVGSPGFSAGGTLYQSLAISSTGTLYVAYRDSANSSKTTVMKYTN
jgi:hypothetical protein